MKLLSFSVNQAHLEKLHTYVKLYPYSRSTAVKFYSCSLYRSKFTPVLSSPVPRQTQVTRMLHTAVSSPQAIIIQISQVVVLPIVYRYCRTIIKSDFLRSTYMYCIQLFYPFYRAPGPTAHPWTQEREL